MAVVVIHRTNDTWQDTFNSLEESLGVRLQQVIENCLIPVY